MASNRPQSHTQHAAQALPVEETVLFWPVGLLQDFSYQKTTLFIISAGRGEVVLLRTKGKAVQVAWPAVPSRGCQRSPL